MNDPSDFPYIGPEETFTCTHETYTLKQCKDGLNFVMYLLEGCFKPK